MLALNHPYRAHRPGRSEGPSPGPADLGLLTSLFVLAAWTALRVASTLLSSKQLDGEGLMATLLFVGVLHALVRTVRAHRVV
jgi:hypothetical protein